MYNIIVYPLNRVDWSPEPCKCGVLCWNTYTFPDVLQVGTKRPGMEVNDQLQF